MRHPAGAGRNLDIPFLLRLRADAASAPFRDGGADRLPQGHEDCGLHLYIAEEAAVGVCASQATELDHLDASQPRPAGQGAWTPKPMAGLTDERDNCCGGRGGTMHLYDRSIGLFGTNGIVAAGISHAVDVGMSARMKGRDDIGVAFFGDGATGHAGFRDKLLDIQRASAVLRY